MKAYQRGFTLIELLISVTIALIISAAIFGIYANSAGSSAALLKSSKLNQELYSLMLVMSNDIRRAGYWGNPIADANYFERPQDNPFSNSQTKLTLIKTDTTVVEKDSSDVASCILYTFDEDEDGVLDIVGDGTTDLDGDGKFDKQELFGFRLIDNYVEMRLPCDGSSTCPTVVTDDCSVGNWEAVTDKNLVSITGLSFEQTASECTYANFPDEPNSKDDDMNGVVDDEPTDCYTVDAGNYVKNVLLADAIEPKYSDYVASIMTVETRQLRIDLQGELVNDPAVTARIEQDVRVRNDRVEEWKIE
jgi:type IV pilus assembly protein PilW